MKAARQNGLPLAAGRQMTAFQKELGEMRREMARLTASNAAMEAELAAVRGGQSSQSTEADMIGPVRREMAAFQQRFDVLESRILRPSLARAGSLSSAGSGWAIGCRRRGSASQPAVAPTGVEPAPVSDPPVDGGQWH
ncbi:hypothetical protein SFRURICE_015381, partial [Spodoptera frugiperda]